MLHAGFDHDRQAYIIAMILSGLKRDYVRLPIFAYETCVRLPRWRGGRSALYIRSSCVILKPLPGDSASRHLMRLPHPLVPGVRSCTGINARARRSATTLTSPNTACEYDDHEIVGRATIHTNVESRVACINILMSIYCDKAMKTLEADNSLVKRMRSLGEFFHDGRH